MESAFLSFCRDNIYRVHGRITNALDLTFVLLWILPAPFVAIELILAHDESNLLVFCFALLGGYWILPIGYAIGAIPLMIRFLRPAIISLDPTANEAGRSLGVPAYHRFFRITLPLFR